MTATSALKELREREKTILDTPCARCGHKFKHHTASSRLRPDDARLKGRQACMVLFVRCRCVEWRDPDEMLFGAACTEDE